MGKYLNIFDRAILQQSYDRNDINDKSPSSQTFGRFGRFGRILTQLERRCPDHIEVADWQNAIEDGRRFLAQWGERAEALGWTARDLFGLMSVPDKPHPTFRRRSRYDQLGLLWVLGGRTVVALTEATAAIKGTTHDAVTVYRRDRPRNRS
jgi:hypothetical protein